MTEEEPVTLHPRIRQLLCLWLITVLTLLPVSGSLMAAVAVGDDGSPVAMEVHHAHHGGMAHAAHHDATGDGHSATLMHDCPNALCAGGCGGCTGCHAPPAQRSDMVRAEGALMNALPLLSSSPPPGAVFRPPIPLSA